MGELRQVTTTDRPPESHALPAERVAEAQAAVLFEVKTRDGATALRVVELSSGDVQLHVLNPHTGKVVALLGGTMTDEQWGGNGELQLRDREGRTALYAAASPSGADVSLVDPNDDPGFEAVLVEIRGAVGERAPGGEIHLCANHVNVGTGEKLPVPSMRIGF